MYSKPWFARKKEISQTPPVSRASSIVAVSGIVSEGKGKGHRTRSKISIMQRRKVYCKGIKGWKERKCFLSHLIAA